MKWTKTKKKKISWKSRNLEPLSGHSMLDKKKNPLKYAENTNNYYKWGTLWFFACHSGV